MVNCNGVSRVLEVLFMLTMGPRLDEFPFYFTYD